MNLTRLRKDTPGTQFHIHLNNAGAAMQPQPVIDAVQHYLHEEAMHGGYEMAAAKHKEIEGFYSAAATLLKTNSRNIAFTTSATDAYSKALSSIHFEKGDVLLTTDDDYVSNQIAFLFLQKRLGVKILRSGKLQEGGADPDSMRKLMDKYRPKLVAVTHVPTNSGLVQDVEAIGRLCRERELLYLVDACQSAGQMPLDVDTIRCDFLSATMRKWLRGPRGAGFLYVSDKVLDAGMEPLFPDLGAANWVAADRYEYAENNARRFEYWEKNYALVLGSKAAINYALDIGLENIEKEVSGIAGYARQQLSELPGWSVLDQGKEKCGIVTAHHATGKPGTFKEAISAARINLGFASTANAYIDFTEKKVEWAMRVSPHYYNTKEEVDRLINVLKTSE